jgi:DNA-binding response OmpR family regulator
MPIREIERSSANELAGIDVRPRVLLVHSEEAGRDYTRNLLENLGGSVTVCSSFEEGIRLLEDESWDLLVLSQGGAAFPGRSLLECAAEIDRRLPVLVLTRWHQMACYVDAMQLGAVDYLEEPVSPAELARVVRTYLPRTGRPERRQKSRPTSPRRFHPRSVTQGA